MSTSCLLLKEQSEVLGGTISIKKTVKDFKVIWSKKNRNKILILLYFLRNHPALYHGKYIHVVNFGLFAALDGGAAILAVYLWYMYAHLGGFSQSFFVLTIILPLFVWGGGAKIYFFAALGKKIIKNPFKYLIQTGFYVQGGTIGAVMFRGGSSCSILWKAWMF